MKSYDIELFISNGPFAQSAEFNEIAVELATAVGSVTWHDDSKFIINPVRMGNGVKPIKEKFVQSLRTFGWMTEIKMSLARGINPGAIDAIKKTTQGIFAVEWETGNISSSHRALNKIAVGILQKQIIGGIIVLPNRILGRYLTDRIGNYEELSPYFPLYKALQIENGVIGVIKIEYDGLSFDAPLIPKGSDGNARKVIAI